MVSESGGRLEQAAVTWCGAHCPPQGVLEELCVCCERLFFCFDFFNFYFLIFCFILFFSSFLFCFFLFWYFFLFSV